MMITLNELGSTGLQVSSICIGTSPLGGMPELYGHDTDRTTALAALERVFESELRFLDTSNGYSQGESERRIGDAIRQRGGLPDGFIVATKADPAPGSRDFSGARVRRSFEESLERLGLERIELFYLHDPEFFDFDELNAPGGAVEAMITLREEGLVDHIGVAGGDVQEMDRYLGTGAFEVLLNHNNFTLVDRSADRLIDRAAELDVAFVNAAPFGGGILAQKARPAATYRYAAAGADLLERVERIRAACDRYGVPLAAAAVQFSLRDPRITSTVVGISRPQRVDDLIAFAELEIPEQLWDEIERVAW